MDNFIFQQMIGAGGYGEVYKAICQRNRMIVAIKKIPIHSNIENPLLENIENIITEVSVLRGLQMHRNIIRLYDICRDESHVYLVMQYALCDLANYMKICLANTMMDSDRIKSYLYQILNAIAYCHARGIIHCNVTPRNLLLYPNDIIKITDFRMAKVLDIRPSFCTNRTMVTLWYKAPELLLGSTTFGFAIDIWSIGCIFGEMATKTPLFIGDCNTDQLFKIFQRLGTPTENTWPDIIRLPYYQKIFPQWPINMICISLEQIDSIGMNLLQMMLIYNPEKRVSSIEALSHPYFYNMDKNI